VNFVIFQELPFILLDAYIMSVSVTVPSEASYVNLKSSVNKVKAVHALTPLSLSLSLSR
jgi:hypothetical protein